MLFSYQYSFGSSRRSLVKIQEAIRIGSA